MNPVEQLVQRLGGVAATARAFDVQHVSVIKWKQRGRLPLSRVAHAVALSGMDADTLAPEEMKAARAAIEAIPLPSAVTASSCAGAASEPAAPEAA